MGGSEFETGEKADGGADAVHRECPGTGSDGVAGGEVGAGTHHSREPGDQRGPGVSRGEGVGARRRGALWQNTGSASFSRCGPGILTGGSPEGRGAESERKGLSLDRLKENS